MNSTQHEIVRPEKKIPLRGHYDVLVCGSGPAGISAAIMAARHGASTLLLEASGDVGGIATSGMMSHFTGTVNSALYREILARSAEQNGIAVTKYINPEQLKGLLFQMLEEAGAKLRLYTVVTDALTENGRVTGVITESKSGTEAFTASVVIDATGDGDVAARAGAAYVSGREGDGKMQPVTLMFKVAGVDPERAVYLGSFESTYQTDKGELQALAKQHLPAPAGHVLLYPSTIPGTVTCNMTNCTEIDGTNTEDLTHGMQICRKQMTAIIDFLREYVPGYEQAYIVSAASLLGVRETRHFIGVKTLTAQDILDARTFEDWVVRDAYFNFDIHNMDGAGLDKTGVQHKFRQKNGYTIPYGCLVPEKLEGLLLAGRLISGTHMAHSNYRAMPICIGMGEAAGIAAALCAKAGIRPRELDVREIQAILLSSEKA